MGVIWSEEKQIEDRYALADLDVYLNAGYMVFEKLLSISRFVFSSVKWGR